MSRDPASEPSDVPQSFRSGLGKAPLIPLQSCAQVWNRSPSLRTQQAQYTRSFNLNIAALAYNHSLCVSVSLLIVECLNERGED